MARSRTRARRPTDYIVVSSLSLSDPSFVAVLAPVIYLFVCSMLIGVDFGGTHVKAGVVEGGEVLRSTTAATGSASSPAQILDLLAGTVLALTHEPEAVGVAIPGEVDAEGR